MDTLKKTPNGWRLLTTALLWLIKKAISLTYDEEYLTIKIFTDKKQLFLFHASERFIYLTEEEATLFMRYTPKQLIGFELPLYFSHSHVRKCIQENVTTLHKGIILDITPMWETTGFIPFHRRWSAYKVKLYKDFVKRAPNDTAF